MSKPTGFLEWPRTLPLAREPSERIGDSREFEGKLQGELRVQQASRCMGCGVPFCHRGCPLHNLIPEFNELVRLGDLQGAKRRLAETNNFPEVTGRVCPAPCEAACVLSISGDPVTIKQIEKAIAAEEDFAPRPPAFERHERVAVIGSGPAGLAAAQQLRRLGYQITVFERSDRVGGLLRYGIPDFKLDKTLVDRRVQQLRKEGVRFVLNTEVGVDIPLSLIERDHQAVAIAVGAERARDIVVPGRDLAGVHFAMEYLEAQNRALASAADSAVDARGKDVVILGGGDTGADCVGTAHRQGARSVTQLEIMPAPPTRRAADNPWPEWPLVFRTSASHEEGGLRLFEASTQAFVGDRHGHVSGVLMRSGDGREQQLPAQLVLIAAGFVGVRTPAFMELSKQRPANWFVAGDARRGASLVVWAIAEGRRMAEAIDHFLQRGSHLESPHHSSAPL